MSEVTYERAKTLMEAELGDELVALDPIGGECVGFNGVAATVWRLLATPISVAALQQALLEQYDVDPLQCGTELNDLLSEMVGSGLARCSESAK